MSNPNTDPHTFEASPSVAQEVSAAQLSSQNGVGYDTFMNKIESAVAELDAQGDRRADAARPAGLHPEPAPLVQADDDAGGREGDRRRPVRAAARARRLLRGERERASTRRCSRGSRRSRRSRRATPARRSRRPSRSPTTCSQAAGIDNLTPFTLQADIMNGIDPSPQDVALQEGLFTQHKVKAFVYNQQVTDSLTAVVPAPAATSTGSRSSASTRRCRPRLRLPVVDARRGAGRCERAVAHGRSTTKL